MSRRRGHDLAAGLAGLAVGVVCVGLFLPATIDADEVRHSVARAGGGVTEAGQPVAATAPTTVAPTGEAAPAAAPVAGGPAAAPASGQARPAAAAGGGASDVGVTAASVKVGFLLLDVGQLGRLGVNAPVVDPALLRRSNQAYVDEINASGGIHGRKIEAVFQNYDLTSAESQRAACLALTEDQKVFAVIGEFTTTDANLCVTQEHRTPLISTGGAGIADEVYADSRGLLFTKYPRGSRQMVHLVAELDRSKLLEGKKIGIVNQRSNDPAGTVGDALEAELDRRGREVVHRADFSADNGEAASQVPVEVQQFRAKGADVLLLLANTVVNTQVAQAAESQAFRPRYYVTDWNYMNSDTGAQNMPASFDGSLGFTHARAYEFRAGLPPTPAGKRCVEIYRRRTGGSTAPEQLSYQSVTTACAQVGELAAGLRGAGPSLTRPALSQALQRAGGGIPEVDAWWARGSYAAGKFDFADQVRIQRWRSGCRCWTPEGSFRTP